ncbi:hypothetical protein H4R24_005301 [Coemansia sp. RSA 988]|nr:hypothetical protein H4R24_005301 [Coemansia sp. RSA 988]
MLHEDTSTLLMAPHNCSVSSRRMTASNTIMTGNNNGNGNSGLHSRPATNSPRNNNNSGKRQKQQQQQPPKQQRTLDANSGKGGRQQSAGRGKPESNQRKTEDGARPKPKRSGRRQKKVVLLTRDASDGEQQSLLARLAPDPPPSSSGRQGAGGGYSSPGTGKRGRQTSPVTEDMHNNQQMHTPTRKQQQQPTQGVLYSPTPRRATGSGPTRGGSPGGSAKSNHYAGASFNNSPAPNTLPLPPSFLTTPTKNTPRRSTPLAMRDEDVFGTPVSPDNSRHHPPPSLVVPAIDERTRHLQSMLDPATHAMLRPPPIMQQPYHSHSAVNLAHQQDSDMESMFQKLRLAMDLAQKRPATVNPVTSVSRNNNPHLTPVHNA